MKKISSLILVSIAISISACGGGGGGGTGGPVASSNTFNLLSGYTMLVSSGWSKTFNITGSCNGTISITRGPASTVTTFESQPALSSVSIISSTFSNCTPSTSTDTETLYYDPSTYAEKGYSVLGGNYAIFAVAPVIPSSARVGDTGIIGSMNRYTNNTKATSAGRQDISYVIEPDTATTAIANVITKYYNSSGNLTSTEQNRYRVAADGGLTPLSLDIQFSNGNTTHLIGN